MAGPAQLTLYPYSTLLERSREKYRAIRWHRYLWGTFVSAPQVPFSSKRTMTFGDLGCCSSRCCFFVSTLDAIRLNVSLTNEFTRWLSPPSPAATASSFPFFGSSRLYFFATVQTLFFLAYGHSDLVASRLFLEPDPMRRVPSTFSCCICRFF